MEQKNADIKVDYSCVRHTWKPTDRISYFTAGLDRLLGLQVVEVTRISRQLPHEDTKL